MRYTGGMKPRDARSLPAAVQEETRQIAVRLVVKEGKTQVEAAQVVGVSRQAVGGWVKAYRKGGERALKARRRGRPKGGCLKPWQGAQIAKAVVHHQPEQLKLPCCLWTREAVGELIERRFGIGLSVWTVGRYLKRWGFTPQRPLRRALEQDPKAVEQWLEERYPAIQRQAKRENARIFWGDEMGVRSDHVGGRSYAKRGKTPVVRGTGNRFGCNMISAISNRGKLYFMLFTHTFVSGVFLEFLKRLVRQVDQKVLLIVDGHGVHKSRAVRQWCEKHRDQIEIFLLPAYSPELNPDEMLNNDVKTNAVRRHRARNLPELQGNVRAHLSRRQRRPHIVRSYFRGPTVRYAAA
jgi:transposase